MQAGGSSLGGWAPVIVGHQWPSETAIAGLNAWIQNRGQIAQGHSNIANLLNAAKTGPLAVQQGRTADALIDLFDQGEQLARDVARKNGVKKDSYSAALSSANALREKLSDIAERYDQEINKILQSSEPAPIKVPQILAAIGRGQQEANLAAANCGGDIGDAGQRILDQEGTDQSFHQFTKANGIDTSQLFRSRDTKDLEPMVKGLLDDQGAVDGALAGGAAGVSPGGGGAAGVSPASSGFATGAGGGAAGVSPASSGFATGPGGGAAGVSPASSGFATGAGGGGAAGVSPVVSGTPTAAGGGSGIAAGSGSATLGAGARPAGFVTTTPGLGPPASPMPSTPSTPLAPSPPGFTAQNAGLSAGSAGMTPTSPPPGFTAQNAGLSAGSAGMTPTSPPPGFTAQNAGVSSGSALTSFSGSLPPASGPSIMNQGLSGVGIGPSQVPFSAAAFQGVPPSSFGPGEWMHHPDMGLGSGANSVPPAAPIAPQVAPTPVSPTTAPTAGSGDWHSAIPAEQPSAPQASSPSYSSPAASSSASAPSSTNAGYMSSTTAPSTSYAGGALPTYGSDLRPPAASMPAGSPSLPPAASNPPPVPGSPSTNPAAGSGGGVAHAGSARSEPAPATSQQQAPVGLAGKAVAAGAGGAVAGAASADATSRIRLQRIVDAVARQESRLAWAAGDRSDDTTILLTDLADGWIPPGIEIPASVTLLEPGRRRGDLEALLGEVKMAVTHTPDRYVPEADESVPTSPRPRHAPEIEELGWELSSATLWRDGLPRLAHTLAKAASSGTGVDPSEVELLQQQMHDVGERVLDAYPDEIDPKHVGNWQLLSAIEALIRGDKVGANYHLAWFQACMASTIGQQR
jgi:hypothetical protein